MLPMIYYDYKFKTIQSQQKWDCIINNTFENMELYHRKQFSMQRLLSYFRKAFKITPATIKDTDEEHLYSKKLLAIYLLSKYSQDSFEVIAHEFSISLDTVSLISSNYTLSELYSDDIRLFFKQFEEDYLLDMKTTLALMEKIKLEELKC